MSFLELLTLMFIGMKIIGVITWSWWIVLAPILFPFYIVAFIIVGSLAALCVAGIILFIIALILGILRLIS